MFGVGVFRLVDDDAWMGGVWNFPLVQTQAETSSWFVFCYAMTINEKVDDDLLEVIWQLLN